MKAATGLNSYEFFDTSTTIEDAVHYAQSNTVNGSVDQGTLPYWYNESIGEDLRRIADFRMHLIVGGNGDRQRTRFKVGVLLHEILERMNLSKSLGGKLPLKMVFYSGVRKAAYFFQYSSPLATSLRCEWISELCTYVTGAFSTCDVKLRRNFGGFQPKMSQSVIKLLAKS